MHIGKAIIIQLSISLLVCIALLVYATTDSRNEIEKDQAIAAQFVLEQPSDIQPLNAEEISNVDGAGSNSDNTAASEEPEIWAVDLAGLRTLNPDAIGWIWQPYTEINYPVVQGEDNSYYLSHSFDGTHSREGAIYIDYRCSLNGNNLVIYGHNTASGKFDSLLGYAKGEEYWKTHPSFVFYSADCPSGIIYDVFSFFKADVGTAASTSKVYKAATDNEYLEYLEFLKSRSIYDTGVEVSEGKHMLLLSTCCYSSNKRMVVCCIEREPLVS